MDRVPRAYRSERRADQARRTRRRVVAAASGLFAQRGYAATTVRAVAAGAGVSVPTVEAAFGSKAQLLKAAIDVAIVGDDEPVPVLARPWVTDALAARSAAELLGVMAAVLAPAQRRSGGLVLAAFEGAASDADLAELADQLVEQRRVTATWAVRRIAGLGGLRDGEAEAVDALWTLMDPAIHERLTHRLGWSDARYQHWFARTTERLLVPDAPTTTQERP